MSPIRIPFFLFFFLLSALACAEDTSQPLDGPTSLSSPRAQKPCVFVFYDEPAETVGTSLGKMHSIHLQNLLGHFPEYRQLYAPIHNYQPGWVEICEAAIYLGSVYGSDIPSVFYSDIAKTQKRFLWAGYSFWNLPFEVQSEKFGLAYDRLTILDSEDTDSEGYPGFFRFFHYLGETFYKSVTYADPVQKTGLVAAHELVATRTIGEHTQVLSWAEHSSSREEVPYITQKNNFFFVADIPFSYVHEADRYLIFADVLFDFLQVAPKHQEKIAFLRIEDVHPLIPVDTLKTVQSTLLTEQVPLHISLVPIYAKVDTSKEKPTETRVAMTEKPDFLAWTREARAAGVHFILHGATHHLPGTLNPVGSSGVDYEFWDVTTDSPVTGNTAGKTLDILESAYEVLEKEDLYPQIWLTPHYLASPTDYRVFAGVFPWNLGRITYFDDTPTAQPDPSNPRITQALHFSKENQDRPLVRRQLFEGYRNEFDTLKLGQFFPYEIYGDVYGQRVLPESLGNVTLHPSGSGSQRTVDDILADAKRNLVLRDTWASFFFHPFLLNSKANGGLGESDNDATELRRLVQGIKDLGYRFVPIGEFMEKHKKTPRVEADAWHQPQ